ncbi:MAG: type VI secretion system baseplate subunit TssK [Cellvibrionaceae bacterium]
MKNNKIAWMESQYLFPQHFQQQERYFESLVEQRSQSIRDFIWGFNELKIDPSLLADSRIALLSAKGIMPDGCPFELPHNAALPTPLLVDKQVKNQLVYLVLPLYQPGSRYIETDLTNDSIARFKLQEIDVFDYCADNTNVEKVESAALQFRFALESEELGGFSCLPIAKIIEVTQEGSIILDKKYIPPSLSVKSNEILRSYLQDVIGMLHQRGDALSHRFSSSTQEGGSAAIADFMLLQLVNRCEPTLKHLASLPQTHPEELYKTFVGLSGELSTFTTKNKRPLEISIYDHDNLYLSFNPIMENLSRQLSVVLEQTAISIPVEKRQYGIHVSRLTDRSLLTQARFVIAINADLPSDKLREYLPNHIKIGSVETIRDLVNNQLTGITLSALPVAPREIPYHAGFIYFELDAKGEQWQSLQTSGGFAFHIAGDLPQLAVEFWGIRS